MLITRALRPFRVLFLYVYKKLRTILQILRGVVYKKDISGVAHNFLLATAAITQRDDEYFNTHFIIIE